jgi:hypothetical protein
MTPPHGTKLTDSDSHLKSMGDGDGISEDRAKLLLERHKTECREDGPLAGLRDEMQAMHDALASMRANFKAWLLIAGLVGGPLVTFALNRIFPAGGQHSAIPQAIAATKGTP